jgi:WD40 repeat protein
VLTSTSPVTGLGFLRNQTAVVSVATDGTARVWRWPGALLGGALDTVFGLSYSNDSRRLAVFPDKGDDSVRIWDTTLPGQARPLGAVKVAPELGALDGGGAISPDGGTLAVALRPSNVVRLWDIGDLSNPVLLDPALSGPTGLIESVAFNNTGTLLAAGSDDGTVRLWDVKALHDGQPIATLRDPTSEVLAVTFSPDSRFLAATSVDKRVYRWDLSSPRQPVALSTLTGFNNYAYTVAYSPNGRLLAAGSADKTLRLWDVTDPRRPRALGGSLNGPGNYVYYIAFNPSGTALAAAVTDGTVWQWDVTDPRHPKEIAMLTAASTSEVFVIAYSPDGDTLVAGDGEVVHSWMTDVTRIGAETCAAAGDGITRQEWSQYLPGQRYRPPCR